MDERAGVMVGVETLVDGVWVWTACLDVADREAMLGRMRRTRPVSHVRRARRIASSVVTLARAS